MDWKTEVIHDNSIGVNLFMWILSSATSTGNVQWSWLSAIVAIWVAIGLHFTCIKRMCLLFLIVCFLGAWHWQIWTNSETKRTFCLQINYWMKKLPGVNASIPTKHVDYTSVVPIWHRCAIIIQGIKRTRIVAYNNL